MNIEKLQRLEKFLDRFVMVLLWLCLCFGALFLTYFVVSRLTPFRSPADVAITAGLCWVIYDISKTAVCNPPWRSACWK